MPWELPGLQLYSALIAALFAGQGLLWAARAYPRVASSLGLPPRCVRGDAFDTSVAWALVLLGTNAAAAVALCGRDHVPSPAWPMMIVALTALGAQSRLRRLAFVPAMAVVVLLAPAISFGEMRAAWSGVVPRFDLFALVFVAPIGLVILASTRTSAPFGTRGWSLQRRSPSIVAAATCGAFARLAIPFFAEDAILCRVPSGEPGSRWIAWLCTAPSAVLLGLIAVDLRAAVAIHRAGRDGGGGAPLADPSTARDSRVVRSSLVIDVLALGLAAATILFAWRDPWSWRRPIGAYACADLSSVLPRGDTWGLPMDEWHAVARYEHLCKTPTGPDAGPNERACMYLGLAYEDGLGGLARDPDRAIALYRQTRDYGLGIAFLGRAHERGLGSLSVDKALGFGLYAEACDSDPCGCEFLEAACANGEAAACEKR